MFASSESTATTATNINRSYSKHWLAICSFIAIANDAGARVWLTGYRRCNQTATTPVIQPGSVGPSVSRMVVSSDAFLLLGTFLPLARETIRPPREKKRVEETHQPWRHSQPSSTQQVRERDTKVRTNLLDGEIPGVGASASAAAASELVTGDGFSLVALAPQSSAASGVTPSARLHTSCTTSIGSTSSIERVQRPDSVCSDCMLVGEPQRACRDEPTAKRSQEPRRASVAVSPHTHVSHFSLLISNLCAGC